MFDSLAAPPVVYALALVPAVLWGVAPVASKRGMEAGGSPLQAALTVVAVDSALYLLALAVTRGADAFGGLSPRALAVFVGAGLVGTALGRVATFAGVERVGASVNSAGISARPLFATGLAVAVLGEPVSVPVVAGIVVLVAGLAVLALSKGGDVRGWRPVELLFPLAAAALFGFGNVLRRLGLTATPTVALEAVALNELAALLGLAAYAVARGKLGGLRTASRRSYLLFSVSGTLTAVALLSLFAALGHPEGRVAVVDPLAATAPLFTTVFAAGLLRNIESVTRGVVAGAVLVVAGAALVTAGPAVL
ncbi:MAG: EamA family transporter [Halolamina sp.]